MTCGHGWRQQEDGGVVVSGGCGGVSLAVFVSQVQEMKTKYEKGHRRKNARSTCSGCCCCM